MRYSAVAMSWIDDKAHAELARVREAREKQVYPYFREFETGGLHTTIGGKPIINFSSNDYLGLTNHPKVKEAAKKAVDKYACGLSSSRVQATTTEHVELEKRLAKWFGFEKCLMFTTGYQAMLGTIVVARRQGHDARPRQLQPRLHPRRHVPGRRASRGARPRSASSTTTRRRASSASSRRASARTRSSSSRASTRSTATRRTSRSSSRSATRYDAVLVVDDAHGTGTLGERGTRHPRGDGPRGQRAGRRLDVLEDVRRHRRASSSASDEVVDLVKHNARSFLFSASLPVPDRRRGVDHPRHARGGRARAGRASCTRRPRTSAASSRRPASTSARATRTSCRSCAARSARRSSCTSRCSSAAC